MPLHPGQCYFLCVLSLSCLFLSCSCTRAGRRCYFSYAAVPRVGLGPTTPPLCRYAEVAPPTCSWRWGKRSTVATDHGLAPDSHTVKRKQDRRQIQNERNLLKRTTLARLPHLSQFTVYEPNSSKSSENYKNQQKTRFIKRNGL
jgi:hypothetical protein